MYQTDVIFYMLLLGFGGWFEERTRKTKMLLSFVLIFIMSIVGWNLGEILYWVGWNIGQMFYFIGLTTSALFVIVIFLVMKYK